MPHFDVISARRDRPHDAEVWCGEIVVLTENISVGIEKRAEGIGGAGGGQREGAGARDIDPEIIHIAGRLDCSWSA